MGKGRARKRESWTLLILLVVFIGGSIFSYPGFSYATSSSSSNSMGSTLAGLQESMDLYKEGDSQAALMKKAETCPFRQMYISGTSQEGTLSYKIGKAVDDLYKSMGGTSTELTESDCAVCNALAGAVGGDSYQQYQQQLVAGSSAVTGSVSTANNSGVTVYTAPGCVHCDRVKQFLKENNVPYTEKDVINDLAAGQEMIAKSGQTGCPVTVINGKCVVGDDLDAIAKLLASSSTTTSGQTSAQKTTTATTTTQSSAQTTSAATQSGTQTTSTTGNSLSGLSGLVGSGSGGGILSKLLGSFSGLSGSGSGNTTTAGNGAALSVTMTTCNTTYTLADGTKKDLVITIWYPSSGNAVAAAGAPYPLVVFSHGMLLGNATQSRFITSGLASKGYIVCATTHEDSVYYRGTKDASPLTKGFNDRPLDVQAIITEMLRLNNTSGSLFYGMIDENAIGMMGHSLGGWTSELVCGGTPPGQESLADSRVKAGVLFDPASIAAVFSSIHVPMMCFFGANSFMKSHGNGSIYESLNPPKYVATVEGLSHMDFSDLGSSKPGAQAVLRYTIAFFDRYLKGDLSTEQILETKDQTFTSYEYDLGEANGGNAAGSQANGDAGEGVSANDSGTAEPEDSQEIGDGWESIPAYGSELEQVSSWQAASSYSANSGADEVIDFGALLGKTKKNSSGDIFSVYPGSGSAVAAAQPEETQDDMYCEDGVCYPAAADSQPQTTETQDTMYCEDGVCYPAASVPQSQTSTQTQTTQSYSQVEQEILRLINQHRVSKGLPVLKANSTLTDLAAAHSQYMAQASKGPNHDGFAERSRIIRNTLGGYGGLIAENSYAAWDDIAANAVAVWLNSPGHRDNIENGKFTLTGIGIACSSQGEYYFTQIFFEDPVVSANSIGAGQETPASIAEADKTIDFSAMLGTTSNSDDSSSDISSGLAAGGAGESAAGSSTAATSPVKEKSVEEIAQELFNLVSNKYLGYQKNLLLTELAVTHSQDMAAKKNQPCNNDGIQERFNQINGIIPGHYYAEVVAGPYKYSNDLAEKVFKRWLERSDYGQAATNWQVVGAGAVPITGIGVARSSTGNYYFTQIFWGMRQ
ncbi:MAG: CAP domain-containing protein [Candidatus Omnitrophota bacterium]